MVRVFGLERMKEYEKLDTEQDNSIDLEQPNVA
jgi:hypothetical protein